MRYPRIGLFLIKFFPPHRNVDTYRKRPLSISLPLSPSMCRSLPPCTQHTCVQEYMTVVLPLASPFPVYDAHVTLVVAESLRVVWRICTER